MSYQKYFPLNQYHFKGGPLNIKIGSLSNPETPICNVTRMSYPYEIENAINLGLRVFFFISHLGQSCVLNKSIIFQLI